MNYTGEITGRDVFIASKALWLAIKYSQMQPEHVREYSDEQDMIAILSKRFPNQLRSLQVQARNAEIFYLPVNEGGEATDISAEEKEAILKYAAAPDLAPMA